MRLHAWQLLLLVYAYPGLIVALFIAAYRPGDRPENHNRGMWGFAFISSLLFWPFLLAHAWVDRMMGRIE